MRNFKTLTITFLVALFAGCVAPTAPTPTEFCTDYIETVCSTVERCGGKYSSCHKQLTGELQCAGWTVENFCDSVGGEYDSDAAVACLDSVDQFSCQEDGAEDICEFKSACVD